MRVQHRAPRGMIPGHPPVETTDAPRIFAWDRHVGAIVVGSFCVVVVVVVVEMRWCARRPVSLNFSPSLPKASDSHGRASRRDMTWLLGTLLRERPRE
ncbi:hypothetical protein BC567DRAFT_222639 [Phyllosticta citribraziliensis]